MSLINCVECGKEISDKAISCPNCGIVLSSNQTSQISNGQNVSSVEKKNISVNKKTNNMCLTGGILGICSLLIDPVAIVSITAIVFSAIGFNQVGDNKNEGSGWAITGLAIGITEFILKCIQLLSEM